MSNTMSNMQVETIFTVIKCSYVILYCYDCSIKQVSFNIIRDFKNFEYNRHRVNTSAIHIVLELWLGQSLIAIK